LERFSDAGEPSGTAGRPILNALRSGGLPNAACVVVRYFGCTKLGVGGLGRAYGDVAKAAVDGARIVTRTITKDIIIDFPYEDTGGVERLCTDFNAEVLQRDYGVSQRITCAVPRSRRDDFLARFKDVTRDRGKLILE